MVATSSPIEEVSSSSETNEASLSTETPACQTPAASIKPEKAYLRDGPDIRFSGTAQYKKGDKFTVLDGYKDWFQVEASKGNKGWLYKEWLAFPSILDQDTLCSISDEQLPPNPIDTPKGAQNTAKRRMRTHLLCFRSIDHAVCQIGKSHSAKVSNALLFILGDGLTETDKAEFHIDVITEMSEKSSTASRLNCSSSKLNEFYL